MLTKISYQTIQKVQEALLKIRTDFPEAYQLLGEDPITLVTDTKHDQTEVLLETYLSSLNALLAGFNKQKK